MKKDELVLFEKKVTSLRAQGKYKETIQNCYELLKYAEQLKDTKAAMTVYLNLAASYYCIGDIEEAFKCISFHRELCDKYGDEADELNTNNTMFLIYEYNKNFDKAKETLEKSIALGKKIKKYNIVSNGYSNYSHICFSAGEYEKALEMADTGLQMARKHKPSSEILELRVKLNIANAQIALNDFDSSKILINEMINSPFLDSYIREKAQCYDLQGQWFSRQKLYEEAFQAYSNAKALVEGYSDVYLLKDIQEKRCKLCDLTGDINSGYKVQKELIALLNEINKREIALTAMKLEIKSDIDSMKKTINHDYLTGVYNRNYIENIVNNWMRSAHRSHENIICMIIDIDKFKSINDKYGHLFGDEVIKQVAKACSDIVSEYGLIGRYGGDEFVVILKNLSADNARKKAEQILDLVRKIKTYQNMKETSVTLSIGVADNLTCNAENFKDLFNVADMNLYKAKQNGRNQAV